MSKKGGTIIKIVAVVAGIAAIGTACYVYRDKIKEFFEKIDLKSKLESAKAFINEKILGAKEDDFFDDADFFDDDATEAEEDTSNRGYTSISINGDEDEEAPATKTMDDSAEEAEETVTAEDTEEDTPFEYEGLSDVSEDEDVLEEEASLDGSL